MRRRSRRHLPADGRSLSSMAIWSASYRVPATAEAGTACSIAARSCVGQGEVQRAQRLAQAVPPAGADQRHDVLAAGEHPGDGRLGDGRAPALRDTPQRLHEPQVLLEVLALEAGAVAAEVGGARSRGPASSGR